MNFKDKVVWITGASSGIGEALAKAFAEQGAHIILSGRRIKALEAVAAGIATDTMLLPFETTDYDVLPAKIDKARQWKGRIDILVNNAGISQRSLAIDTHPDVHHKIINVDLLAPIWLTQLLLPHMVEAGGGHIVGISSVAGRIGAPLRTAYSAAKHGLIGYMDALRAETELLHNIHVTNILPGSIKTDVSRNALTKEGERRGKSDAVIENGLAPEECARQILEAVANNVPELIIAEGPELMMAQLRQSDPEQLFAMLAQFGAQTAEKYEAGDDD
ncbi:SDR family NAD(P)-dependent oxidoreductase [Parasphingorhabdus halotolerans]|uniref:SDR family NAD(P)-dependent oxidoreductase n=1 Tax=Parasphingorhabdus halotolerans TaxID=2725558 RepID=A0A6H2DLX8_9SPHN|nr:SDR family NAD(P)-dependent oxidoreductase [Parasphingorhabdus halotolerans]QJB68666.1 SDR family NAD(P)-dependent oxidoreductase [Parasphingorhabdus halotolerans]